MTVVHDLPPRWPEFVETFGLTRETVERRSIAFTFGTRVYFLPDRPMSAELAAHEKVHMRQQRDQVNEWWDRYFVDPEFRASQELEAHRVGLATYRKREKDRNMIARFAYEIAVDLAGGLYGDAFRTPGDAYEALTR